jgi:formate dehydrogenase subunit gamma
VSAVHPNPVLDPAIVRARREEDVVEGGQIVRHRLASRLIHWSVALSFAVTLGTGLPIWTPVFGWLAYLFGGLQVCRWLHPWAGVAFFATSALMFFHWLKEMILRPSERDWLGPKLLAYMRHETTGEEDVGKYNGGQKLFFFATSLGAVGLLLSGLILWFPTAFPPVPWMLAILLHEITFILFTVAIVLHIYLGTAAEPGTFRSMTRGTVTRAWARLHHPGWYRELIDLPRRRGESDAVPPERR